MKNNAEYRFLLAEVNIFVHNSMTSQCRFTYWYGCQVLFQSFYILVETCTTIQLETSQLWWCGKASHRLSDLKCQRWEFCFMFSGYWPVDMWTLNFIHLYETALIHRRRFPCRKCWLLFYDIKNCHHLIFDNNTAVRITVRKQKVTLFCWYHPVFPLKIKWMIIKLFMSFPRISMWCWSSFTM